MNMDNQAKTEWEYIDEGRYKSVYIVSPQGDRFELGDKQDFKRLAKVLKDLVAQIKQP